MPPQRSEVAAALRTVAETFLDPACGCDGIGLATVSGETINGIPRVDPRARRGVWKRAMQRLVATRPGIGDMDCDAATHIDKPVFDSLLYRK